MKRLVTTTALLIGLSVSGCSFLWNGEEDRVYLTTSTGKPADCRIIAGKKSFNVTTPTTIRVNRDVKSIKINCLNRSGGTRGVQTVKAVEMKELKGSYDYQQEIVINMYVPKKKKVASNTAKVTTDEFDFEEDPDNKPLNILPASAD